MSKNNLTLQIRTWEDMGENNTEHIYEIIYCFDYREIIHTVKNWIFFYGHQPTIHSYHNIRILPKKAYYLQTNKDYFFVEVKLGNTSC